MKKRDFLRKCCYLWISDLSEYAPVNPFWVYDMLDLAKVFMVEEDEFSIYFKVIK